MLEQVRDLRLRGYFEWLAKSHGSRTSLSAPNQDLPGFSAITICYPPQSTVAMGTSLVPTKTPEVSTLPTITALATFPPARSHPARACPYSSPANPNSH